MGNCKSPSQDIPTFYNFFYAKPIEVRIAPEVFNIAVVIS